MLPHRLRFILTPAVLLLAAAFLYAACAEEERVEVICTPPTTGTPVEDVPELEDGTLTVGSDIAYAPMEFFIAGTETPDGVDIDIAKCLAEELGVAVEFINTGFEGIIEALRTAEFDVIMSAMTITEERLQEIDFVPYLNVGVGILVPAGNLKGIQTEEDLCGLTVAVQIATIQADILEDLNRTTCADNKVNVVTFDTNPLAVEDLRTGGSDAQLADFPVVFEDARLSEGALEYLETQIDPAPYGIGLRKESAALKQAIADAFQAVRDGGKYDQILAKWGVESTRLP